MIICLHKTTSVDVCAIIASQAFMEKGKREVEWVDSLEASKVGSRKIHKSVVNSSHFLSYLKLV